MYRDLFFTGAAPEANDSLVTKAGGQKDAPPIYTKDQFHLIAFFQYNISRGGMTGRLR